MDIKILEEYKKRLVNFSGRNQTLKRNKLYAKRAFDLTKAEKYEKNLINLILNEILCDTSKEVIVVNKNKKIVLDDNDTEKINKDYLKLIKNSQKIKALYSSKELNTMLEDKNSIIKIKKILEEEKKESIKNELDGIFRSLDILKNEIDTVEKETGLYQLYIGYPFLEGKLEDGTEVRAPLFLFPCRLEKKDGKFIYKNLNENSIYINRSFLLAYSSATKKEFKNIKEEYDTVEEIFSIDENLKTGKKFLKECFNFLAKNEIHIDGKFSETVENYKDYKKNDYFKFNRGELYLKNYFIIGQYTIGDNGIYKDYELLCEKDNLNHEIVNTLLAYDKDAIYNNDEIITSIEKSGKIDEKQSFFITELDYSQEKAIKMAEELKSLVIYGPPGTGKSQVIANIISDNLAKNKKILVVSEKRTALDVVYKRLEKCKLSERIGFVHDIKSDRQKILEKITSILDEIENENIEKNKSNDIENISERIESKIKKLDNLKTILFKKQPCGISLYELYSNSKLEGEKNLEIINNFDKYNFFNYEELNSFIKILENIKDSLIYDSIPILANRNSFREKSDLENITLVQKLKNINNFYENNRKENIIINLKESIEKNYNNLLEKSNKEKESFENNINIELNKVNFLLDNEINQNKAELQEKILNRKEKVKVTLQSEIPLIKNKIQNLKSDLEKIKLFDPEIYKNLENLDRKRKEYNSLSFFSFFKKLKLKKELMGLQYGNTIDEKLKQIEEIQNLKIDNQEILDNLIFVLNSRSLRDLKNNISEKILNLEKLEKELINLEVIEEDLYFSQKANQEILELNNLQKEYNLLFESLEILNKNKVKLTNKNLVDLLNEIEKLMNDLKRYYEKREKYLKELENDFKKIKIINLSGLKYFIDILKKYDCITEFEKIKEYLREVNSIFLDVDEISKEFKTKVEDMYNRFFNSQESMFCKITEILSNDFEKIRDYDIKKYNLDSNEKIIFELFKESTDKNKFLINLKNTYCLKWIEKSEKENNIILNDIQYFEEIKNSSFNLIQEKKKLIPEFILEKWNNKIKSNFKYNRRGREVTYSEIRNEATKKRKVLSLRNYIARFKDEGLFDILPCWLLTPEVVSDILPLDENIFDIIIFDEASQIFVEKAIPAIYRAKSIVIAGDDKQLQPNSVAKKKLDIFDEIEVEEEIEEEFEENDSIALDEVSLLDVAKKMYKGALLSYHYRSNYEELINFSNYAFYKGRLIVAPNRERKEYLPIERIKVDGIWENRKNLKEAEETYKIVKNILKERKENESIGIVTFNENQRELIRTFLEDQCEKDSEFSYLYQKEKDRHEENEDKSIFIKNIENVQGDERDIIIFSIGYAKDIETGRVASRFGTLSQAGGENRLNVAISRAKKKIYVITSIEPEELIVETSKNDGPKLFKKYLQYVKAVSEKDENSKTDILKSLFKMYDIKENKELHFDSDFEKEVYSALKDCNYEVHTQVGVSGYRIDLGIYSRNKSGYILGIECDGATYHSSPSARERDVYRQKFLESRGWTIHRIWSKDWWRSPEKEIKKIRNILEKIS